MKRLFALLLLAAMLFTLCACKKTTDAATQTDNMAVNAIPPETASAIVYSDGSITSRFIYKEDKWYWQDDESFPLDGQYIEELTEILISLGKNPPLGVTSDPAPYGLSDAVRYLSVADEEGTLVMLIGTTAPEGGRYMAIEGDTSGSIYLAPQELLDAMARPIYEMALLPALPEIKEENMVSVRLSRGAVSYYGHKVNGAWRSGGKDVPGAYAALWEDMKDWRLARCVDFDPATGVYELCGLDEPLKLELVYTNSVGTASEFVMYIGDGRGEEKQEYYVTVGNDTTVYSMDAATLETILSIAQVAKLSGEQ